MGDSSDLHEKCPHLPSILFDEHNCDMMDYARPIVWTDPKEADTYDMLVIGGGAGGLVTSVGSAAIGAKVALIERCWIGGDCLVTGCIPSKAFLKAANVAHDIKNAG